MGNAPDMYRSSSEYANDCSAEAPALGSVLSADIVVSELNDVSESFGPPRRCENRCLVMLLRGLVLLGLTSVTKSLLLRNMVVSST